MLKAIAVGNLTRDPERATDKNGTEYAKFSVAVNNNAGRNKETYYLSCVAFGQRGSFVLNYLRRGSPVYVDGELSLFIPQDGGKPVMRLNIETVESVRGSGQNLEPVTQEAPVQNAPVRSAAPVPDGGVDVTDQFLNGKGKLPWDNDENDVPF